MLLPLAILALAPAQGPGVRPRARPGSDAVPLSNSVRIGLAKTLFKGRLNVTALGTTATRNWSQPEDDTLRIFAVRPLGIMDGAVTLDRKDGYIAANFAAIPRRFYAVTYYGRFECQTASVEFRDFVTRNASSLTVAATPGDATMMAGVQATAKEMSVRLRTPTGSLARLRVQRVEITEVK